MSDLYFIRHGQAGTRLVYDTLSDLGREQSRLLGEYLARQAVTFSNVIRGGNERHRQTLQGVLEAYAAQGQSLPEPLVDPEWNEFDLDAVYQSIAPQLSRDDPKFANAYAAMRRQIEEHGAAQDSVINRRWNPCDAAVVQAWVAGRYPVSCQPWTEFRDRIRGACARLLASNPAGNVAVFTSATPTAISLASVMEVSELKMFHMAGVMINSAISVLRLKDGEARMFSFNAVPHLDDASLRTHR